MRKPLKNNKLLDYHHFPQTFAKPCCSLAFLRCSILFRVRLSVTEIPVPFKSFLFLKTWCLSLYRVNFTIIARGFWPGPFRFPNLWLLSILISDISMFSLLFITSRTISSVSSVFVSINPWISKQFPKDTSILLI